MTKRLLQTRNSITVNKDMVSRANIRKKEHIIVKGVTHMISDTTMNGIFYPGSEVKALVNAIGTDRVTMPSGHPVGDSGEFISTSDPLALTSNFIGAYAFNFSIQDDRVISDVAIDPIFASTSEDGKTILNAIESGESIDISTGFYLNVEEKDGYGSDGEPYNMIASNLYIDHSAFLPNETGAKNKLEGVGLHTNSAKSSDGLMVDTDVALLNINASTPAMRLPIAPDSHVWNEAQALSNVRAFTNSSDKPSTSYRKFFLNFDQDNVDSFDSYTDLFADVIGGVPHAVKQPISNAGDNAHAQAYVNRFKESKTNTKSFIKSVINKIFSVVGGEQTAVNDDDFVYRDKSGKLHMQQYKYTNGELAFTGEPIEVVKIANEYKPIINEPESTNMDKAKLIAILATNGVTVKSDISDEELATAFNTAMQPAAPVVDTATNAKIDALTATVESLTATITANSDKELTEAVASVVALNKGIDEATAKVMGLTACNAFLAANGQPAFSANHGKHTQVNADESCASLTLEA